MKWLGLASPLRSRKLAIPWALEYREELTSKNLHPLIEGSVLLVAICQPGCYQLPAFRAGLSTHLLDRAPIGWTCLNVVFPGVHAENIAIPAGSCLWTVIPLEYRVVPS